MKKKVLLCIQIALSFNQSNAEVFSYNDLINNPAQASIAYVVKDIAIDKTCTIDIPPISLGIAYNGSITLKTSTKSINIPYKYVPYHSLTDFEKNIFDYFLFDQNQFITVVGLDTKFNYYNKGLMPGSFAMGSNIKYLNWVNIDSKPIFNPNLIPNINSGIYIDSTSINTKIYNASKLNTNSNNVFSTYHFQLNICPKAKASVSASYGLSDTNYQTFFTWSRN